MCSKRRLELDYRVHLGRRAAAGPTGARWDDAASPALKPCCRATSDRHSRGAEIALPLLCMDAGGRDLLDMVRVRCLGEDCVLLSLCEAL